MMLHIDAPHFVAGIDFEAKEAAPILRWALKRTKEDFLQYCQTKGYKVTMAATIISGKVDRVNEKETKFGAMFSILVKDNWYGMGKSTGGVKAGDYVEFAAETNARGFTDVVKGTIKPVAAPAGKTAPVAAQASGSPSYDSRQDSIIFQSSRKDALVFVGLLLTAGKIDFGKAKGADAIAVLEAYVDKFTEHFIEECKTGEPHPSQADDRAAAETRGEIEADRIPF